MLTKKQEQFVLNVLEGMSQAEAYRSAYNTKKMSDKTIWENASRLMANSKVAARLAELRNELAKKSIMTAQERLEYLTKIISGEDGEHVMQMIDGENVEVVLPADVGTRIKAIDIMNKMQGEYVTKVEGNIGVTKIEDLI